VKIETRQRTEITLTVGRDLFARATVNAHRTIASLGIVQSPKTAAEWRAFESLAGAVAVHLEGD